MGRVGPGGGPSRGPGEGHISRNYISVMKTVHAVYQLLSERESVRDAVMWADSICF